MKKWTPVALALLLRTFGLLPFVLDDDEAWFSASGLSLGSPRDYFAKALDNKPPGMAWYYEAVAALVPAHVLPKALPILARALDLGLLLVAALACGRIAERVTGNARAREAAALLTLLGLSAFHPKTLSVSNESLMIPLICLAYWLAVARGAAWRWFAAGALLGAAVLVKQTALLFAFPLLAAGGGLMGVALALAGMASVVAAGAWAVGPLEFWYWSWIYPLTTLVDARERLFSGWLDGLVNAAVFCVALAPFWVSLPEFGAKRARLGWAWLAASAGAILIGRGLFPHYFLLAVPPLAILASHRWVETAVPWKHAWLWAAAATVCALSAVPGLPVLWGDDLGYYARLARTLRFAPGAMESVQIWGANALPLAMSGASSYGRFLTSRFLSPPYATAATLEEFSSLLDARPPELVVDLHARGDNQFNFPITQNPHLERAIERDYQAWVDPSLPWACFFLRKGDERDARPSARGLCESRCLDSSSEYYPRSLGELRELASLDRWWLNPLTWRLADRLLRIRFTLEILRNSCPRLGASALAAVEEGSRDAIQRLAHGRPIAPGDIAEWEGQVRRYFEAHGFGPPYVLDNPGWWASLAVVELQPVARSR